MARNRLNAWPSIADLFSALTVAAIAALVIVALQAATLATEVTALKTRLSEVEAENAKLRSLSPPDLRSKATPSCVEKNKASDWLFTAVIHGADQYSIEGRDYTFTELLRTYQAQNAQAKQDGCVHRVKVYYSSGISGSDYDYALRQIEEVFYTRKLGVQQ